MADPFPIYVITRAMAIGPEQVGSKRKFWLRFDGRKALFKYARPDSGEPWAERIVADLAALLGLPHAEYDLAECEGEVGVLSWSFQDREIEGQPEEPLTLGNEILAGEVTGYPRVVPAGRHRRTPQHTVETVLRLCTLAEPPLRWTPPDGIVNGADVLVGYLLLDAWVGNTDRHDENWAWVRDPATTRVHLAPTFDHASSLGRNERDSRRAARLASRDSRSSVGAYAHRARSGLYREGGARPLTTLEAFELAATLRPAAADMWRARLRGVASEQWHTIVERVPAEWASPVAREFAIGILRSTRQTVLGLGGDPR